MLTPENTIRETPDEKGFRYLTFFQDDYGGYWIAYEQGERFAKKSNRRIIHHLDGWDVGMQGPAEYKDLPIVYNDFVSLPEFEDVE